MNRIKILRRGSIVVQTSVQWIKNQTVDVHSTFLIKQKSFIKVDPDSCQIDQFKFSRHFPSVINQFIDHFLSFPTKLFRNCSQSLQWKCQLGKKTCSLLWLSTLNYGKLNYWSFPEIDGKYRKTIKVLLSIRVTTFWYCDFGNCRPLQNAMIHNDHKK